MSNSIPAFCKWLAGTSEYGSILAMYLWSPVWHWPSLCSAYNSHQMLVSLCPLSCFHLRIFLPGALFAWKQCLEPFCPLTIQTPAKSWCLPCLLHWSPVSLRTAYRCLLDLYELGHCNVRTHYLPAVIVIVFFFEMNHHISLSSSVCLLYLYFCHSFTFQTTVIQLRMKHWFLHLHAHICMKKNYIPVLVLFPPDLLFS